MYIPSKLIHNRVNMNFNKIITLILNRRPYTKDYRNPGMVCSLDIDHYSNQCNDLDCSDDYSTMCGYHLNHRIQHAKIDVWIADCVDNHIHVINRHPINTLNLTSDNTYDLSKLRIPLTMLSLVYEECDNNNFNIPTIPTLTELKFERGMGIIHTINNSQLHSLTINEFTLTPQSIRDISNMTSLVELRLSDTSYCDVDNDIDADSGHKITFPWNHLKLRKLRICTFIFKDLHNLPNTLEHLDTCIYDPSEISCPSIRTLCMYTYNRGTITRFIDNVNMPKLQHVITNLTQDDANDLTCQYYPVQFIGKYYMIYGTDYRA